MNTIQLSDGLYHRLWQVGQMLSETPDQVVERILSQKFAVWFFFAGECPICKQGGAGFMWCSNQKQMILLCDECDSIWLSPQAFHAGLGNTALRAESPDFIVPGTNCSLGSRWATQTEIEAYGWGEFIAGSGSPLGEA